MHAYACICMQCVLLITSYGNYNIYCPYIAEANSQWGGREAEGTDVFTVLECHFVQREGGGG